jgi:hypothetical protein
MSIIAPEIEMVDCGTRSGLEHGWPHYCWHAHAEYELHLINITRVCWRPYEISKRARPMTGHPLHNWVTDHVRSGTGRHRDMLVHTTKVWKSLQRLFLNFAGAAPLRLAQWHS